jgi:hypothetical protein
VRRLTLVRLYSIIERSRDAGLSLTGGIPTLVIKEVNGSHAANRIMSLFPRSRMIFLVRDGRDVLDSMIDAARPEGWLGGTMGIRPVQGADDERDWIKEVCRRWVAGMDLCANAFEAHDPALRRQVRYEDLLADTAGVLGDLARWIGLPANERRVQTVAGKHSFENLPDWGKGPGKHRRSATPGGWRTGLTPAEQQLAEEIMGDRLAKLGYERASEPA